MDAIEQLKQDVREGRVGVDRLIDVIVTQQRQLESALQELKAARQRIEELEKKVGGSGTAKVDEPFSMRAEEKRQQVRSSFRPLGRQAPVLVQQGTDAKSQVVLHSSTLRDRMEEHSIQRQGGRHVAIPRRSVGAWTRDAEHITAVIGEETATRKDSGTHEMPLEADLGDIIGTQKSLADYIDPVFLADDSKKDAKHDTAAIEAPNAKSPEPLAASSPPSTPDDAPGPFDAILQPPARIIHLRRGSLFRPVNFRWQLGLHLAADGRVPRDWQDKSIIEARDFVRHLKSCNTDAYQIALEKMEPEKFGAVMLYLADPPQTRWEVETRLLAGEPSEGIARKMGIAPRVILTYESWFFAVTDRLDRRDYIVHQVIRCHALDAEMKVGTLWKHYAYFGGSVVLDALIYGSNMTPRPQHCGEIEAFLAADARATISLKAMVSARLMAVKESTYSKILNLWFRFRKLEAMSRVSTAVPVDYSQNIRAMLDGLPWTKKRRNEKIDALVGKLPPGLN